MTTQQVPEKSLTMCLIAEFANTTLLLACLFDMDIQESLVQYWYTSLPTGL